VKLENPPQPEQYDPAAEQPVREMAILLGGVLVISLALALVLAYFAGMLAPRLPFAVERDFMATRMTADPRFVVQEAGLQQLADRLGAALNLPAEMKLTLHYSNDMTVNAYATLGGHIVVYRGLLSRVTSENALAAVLAHEIAHVRHRHPAAAAGRGIAIGLVITLLSSAVGNSVAERIMGTAGMGVLLNYSREQETAADEDALRAVAQVYGHLGGAADLFETLKQSHPGSEGGFEIFRSHPFSDRRIEHVREFATRNGIPVEGPLTPLALSLPAAAGRK
jgi:predicted Zn-dependent protease